MDEMATVYAVDVGEELQGLQRDIEALHTRAVSVRRAALMVDQMDTEARMIEACSHLRWAAGSTEAAHEQLRGDDGR